MKSSERIERLAEIQNRIDNRLGPDESLPIDSRIIHALARVGLLVDDTHSMTDRQLRVIPDMGTRRIKELRDYVSTSEVKANA